MMESPRIDGVPYIRFDESSMLTSGGKCKTPVQAAAQLLSEYRARTGSHGVRGRSTSRSEHVISVTSDLYRVELTRERMAWVASISPVLFVCVPMLRLNLVSSIYIMCFLLSATTHPFLTGIEPWDPASRCTLTIYVAAVTAGLSLFSKVATEIALEAMTASQRTFVHEPWAELAGLCSFREESAWGRLKCTVPEVLLLCLGILLRTMKHRLSTADCSELADIARRQPVVTSFSVVAVLSGMSAASHPAVLDIPLIMLFITYIVSWSRQRWAVLFTPGRPWISHFRRYCALLITVHYVTFVPYLANHIPDLGLYKVLGLSWLHDSHGKEGKIQLEVKNVFHIFFLAMLHLALCAFTKRDVGVADDEETEEESTMEDGAMNDPTTSLNVLDMTVLGMVSIKSVLQNLNAAELKELISLIRLPDVGDIGDISAYAEKRGSELMKGIIQLLVTNSHRYCSRILIVLLTLIIVIMPSVVSSMWLILFLMSMIRKHAFFELLTSALYLAVIHVVGVWTFAVVSDYDEQRFGNESSTVHRSMEVAGFAITNCGGIGSGSCTLVTLPVLGLLLVFVGLTKRLYIRFRRRGGTQDDTAPVIRGARRFYHRMFIGLTMLTLLFASCWTIDAAHCILFVTAIVLFYRPSLAMPMWPYVLAYVSILLTFLYLFNVLERDFFPAMEQARSVLKDIVGLHSSDAWQLFPLFLLLFFSIKQWGIFKEKRSQEETAFEMNQLDDLRPRSPSNPLAPQHTSPPSFRPPKIRYRVFYLISNRLGVPCGIVLDVAALLVMFIAIGFQPPSIFSVLLYMLVMIMALMSLSPWGRNLTYYQRSMGWRVIREITCLWAVLLYLYQWQVCKDAFDSALKGMGGGRWLGLIYVVVKDDGGSLKAFRELMPLVGVIVFADLEVGVKGWGVVVSKEAVAKQNRVTLAVKQLAVSYTSFLTITTLFVAAVYNTSDYRSTLISIPFAIYLCIFSFSPTFASRLHPLVNLYCLLATATVLAYQFPLLNKNIHPTTPHISYIGLDFGGTNLSVAWTYTLAFIAGILALQTNAWRNEGCMDDIPPLTYPEEKVPADDATVAEHIVYSLGYFFRRVKMMATLVGRQPAIIADTVGFHSAMLALLIGIYLRLHTAVALIYFIVLIVCCYIGKAGMALPLCGNAERWRIVLAVTWIILIIQYLTYLGLPNGNSNARKLPYNVDSLGEWRGYLSVDVTPKELAVEVAVALCVVIQAAAYRRARFHGHDPYSEYESSLRTTPIVMVENWKELLEAKKAIVTVYSLAIGVQRVPYPLGDIHAIGLKGGLPLPGCGCNACSSVIKTYEDHDYTPSARHTRTPLEYLRYYLCLVLPYVILALVFLDGCVSSDPGLINLTKIMMSMYLLHRSETLKWKGTHMFKWINRLYTFYLFTTILLYVPTIKGYFHNQWYFRHFGIKSLGFHAVMMGAVYVMCLIYDSKDWVWMLYCDQEQHIKRMDIGEVIQQEWLSQVDEKKRQIKSEKEKRALKLKGVRLGYTSKEVTICPKCARMQGDELCEECAEELAMEQRVVHSPILVKGQPRSALEERLLSSNFLNKVEEGKSLLAADDFLETCSEETPQELPLELSRWGKDTTRKVNINDQSMSISTVLITGAQGTEKKLIQVKGKKKTDAPAYNEFGHLPYSYLLNNLVDTMTKLLRDNSLPRPAKSYKGRYAEYCDTLGWFLKSNTGALCYLMFIIDFIREPCYLSLPLPISFCVYALIIYPRPHTQYWLGCLMYLYMEVTFKAISFTLLKGWFDDIQLSAPFLFGAITDLVDAVAVELLSIVAILVHRHFLRSLGLWSNAPLYYQYDDEQEPDETDKSELVVVKHRNCEEVLDGELLVLELAEVEYSLSGRYLKKSIEGFPTKIITHLFYNNEKNTMRDQDGCGGSLPDGMVGRGLRDLGRLAEIAGIEHDLPIAGGSAVAVAKAAREETRMLDLGGLDLLRANIFNENNLKIGTDYYTYMFCLDFVAFVMFIFSYYSIGDGGGSDLAASLSSNMLPGSLVLTQLALLIIIIIDRILYLYQAVAVKFIFQVCLTAVYFALFSWWCSSRLTSSDSKYVIRSFGSPNAIRVVTALFCIKVTYLVLAALQIREGYERIPHNFFGNKHHPVFAGLYELGRAVPFVYELKVVLDWTFTTTTLKFRWWVKAEDIAHELYLARCDLEETRLLNKELEKDKRMPASKKATDGCGVAILLVIVIFFPLMFYSSFSPALTSNYVEQVTMSIGIVGAPPFYTGRDVMPATNRRGLSDTTMRHVELTRPSALGFDFTGKTVQLSTMSVSSQTVWWITEEARSSLVQQLWNVSEALVVAQGYDLDKDGALSYEEARSMMRYSVLGPRSCDPNGPSCPTTVCDDLLYDNNKTLSCCVGMALWEKVANSSRLMPLTEDKVLDLYVEGVFNVPLPAEISIDLVFTRKSASDASLLEVSQKLRYTIPPAARVALSEAISGNGSVYADLPNMYSPFVFNRRGGLEPYDPETAARLNCRVAIRGSCDTKNNNCNGFVGFSTDIMCEALFENGNPYDPQYEPTKTELDCFSKSNHYRSPECPDYNTKCNTNKDTSLFLVIASDTVTDNSGLGSLLASFSITALYTTFVLTIGRFIRSFFVGSSYRVILEDMQDPRPVEYIIQCMYYARCENDLQLEAALYQELLRLYRSPESLKEFTAADVV